MKKTNTELKDATNAVFAAVQDVNALAFPGSPDETFHQAWESLQQKLGELLTVAYRTRKQGNVVFPDGGQVYPIIPSN